MEGTTPDESGRRTRVGVKRRRLIARIMIRQENQGSASDATAPTELELLAPVPGGQMLARSAGQVVFVHGGIPGEIGVIAPPMRKRGYLETEALSTIRRSSLREAPPCPFFGENGRQRGAIDVAEHDTGPVCGGCQYQHIDYDVQLGIKHDVLADALRRVGKILDAPLKERIASPLPYQYRNKASWLITADGEFAYRAARSHTPVPIDECHLLTPAMRELFLSVLEASTEVGLAGLVHEVEARSLEGPAPHGHNSLVLDLAAATSDAEAQALADALMEACPGLSSIAASRRGGRGSPSSLGTSVIQPGFCKKPCCSLPRPFFK